MENYSEKVAGFTDEQLNVYIEQRHRYIPEIVAAAVIELQKRGKVFTEEEIGLIYADIEIKPGEEKQAAEIPLPPPDLAEAPEYYSPRLIRIYSVLFSVLFGSVMMAMNLSRTTAKKGVIEVLIFGLAYTTALIVIGSRLPANSGGIGILLNIAGGLMIEYFFWNRYIGGKTYFRKRNFVFPLLIGLAVSAVLIAVIFLTK
jgi:hypothetical protein